MIQAATLLKDLQGLLKTLEDDLRIRITEDANLTGALQAEWRAARDAKRSGETYAAWLETVITQAAVHWLLSCVFVRFVEDNGLAPRPWLSGSGDGLSLARDRHETYFRSHPHDSDREYLIACFREVEKLPGMGAAFDERHNPVFRLGISGDAAMALLAFWQKVDPDSGRLTHDFTDPNWNTRFLGDLYQDLSEATRKRYALLQTPEFVEEFILDRTLTPALDEFGYKEVRLIDPTCGSGHFLLGAFQRLLDVWASNEPARNLRDTVQQALNGVWGVDLNPYAIAIARFRLLLAALKACDIERLADAPAFRIHLAVGDSLLHGARFGLTENIDLLSKDSYQGTRLEHAYAIEDLDEVNEILGRQYHAVVGNPPYITVKDAALNAAYRAKYSACHRTYSLGVPFTQRFFELALHPSHSERATGTERNPPGYSAGYVGLITTNSFMKREFGKKLIEQTLPQVDLTHVIDTAGAYIPGHGTPTVILFGRHRLPVGETVRTVMGIKGEPATPANPSQGLVWRAIVGQLDKVGSESAFVSVVDTAREGLSRHPWSIGGGGLVDLLEQIETSASKSLKEIADVFGGTGRTSADDALIAPRRAFHANGVEHAALKPLIEGEQVRDWSVRPDAIIATPYNDLGLEDIEALPGLYRWLWPMRTVLGSRVTFGKSTYFAEGRPWWGWHQITIERLKYFFAITFGEVATHNHFVLDRGGKVFKQTAPVIKLPMGVTEDDHLGLLGLLNSSVACFWLKQVCFPKGGDHVGQEGARVRKTLWDERYAFNSTNVSNFPLVGSYPTDLARMLDCLAEERAACLPQALVAAGVPTRDELNATRTRAASLHRQMIAWQEELDWRCYRLYGLLGDEEDSAELHPDYESAEPPEINFGERAFEIVLARRMAAGEEETTWFARHNATPITELPGHWPADYRRVVEARIALIESDKYIGLIERPEYKRRWAATSWDEQEQAALKGWLLDRLESTPYWVEPVALTTTTRLSDRARSDTDFMQVAELFTGRGDFDVAALVAELVARESVPFLPVLRYSEAGLRKREQWEATWALQRREDAIDAEVDAEAGTRRAQLERIVRGESENQPLDESKKGWVENKLQESLVEEKKRRKQGEIGDIPVPPKYKSKDFLKTDFWRLRGGLDVPKERWISYPGCERGADGSLVVAWAGWNHLQQATALAGYYVDMKDNEGWDVPRLQPLLAGLLELVPWLRQWHNDYDPEHAIRMGDYFASFVTDEARGLGLTLDDLRAWKPAATTARRRRKAKA